MYWSTGLRWNEEIRRDDEIWTKVLPGCTSVMSEPGQQRHRHCVCPGCPQYEKLGLNHLDGWMGAGLTHSDHFLPTHYRSRGLPLHHTHTHTHTVGLLWTRDRPVAETSSFPRRNSNPQSQETSDSTPTPKTVRPLGSALSISYYVEIRCFCQLECTFQFVIK